jgi:hypothetical protein
VDVFYGRIDGNPRITTAVEAHGLFSGHVTVAVGAA